MFVDVDRDTLGLSPAALRDFLAGYGERRADGVYNRASGRRLAACVPMHTCGLPGRIQEIVALCNAWGIPVVEDAAERDALLAYSNAQGVMTRPLWRLMHRLPLYVDCQQDGLEHSLWLEARVVNVPSSVPEGVMGKWAH